MSKSGILMFDLSKPVPNEVIIGSISLFYINWDWAFIWSILREKEKEIARDKIYLVSTIN